MIEVTERVVFVTGKGGVGKSTIAAALCLAAAERREPAILVEFEGATAARRALGDEPRVQHTTIEYFPALQAAITSMVKSALLARVMVNQKALRRVLSAVPAIRELVALEAVRVAAAADPRAQVVVDLPATGHAVDWLRVPAAAQRFLRTGPAAQLCQNIRDELLDPTRSALVVVGTAEPVVASETSELIRRIELELERTPRAVVLNRVPGAVKDETLTRARRAAERDPAYRPLADAVAEDIALARDAREALGLVAHSALWTVPDFFRDPAPGEVVAALEALP